MQPLVRAALVAAVLSALVRVAELRASERRAAHGGPTAPPAPSALRSLCPRGTLPDAEVCIPVPSTSAGGEELRAEQGAHTDKSGRFVVYEHIPRRPDREADYRRYRMPVEARADRSFDIESGYDLDLPDAEQRRGAAFSVVGHGGIDIGQKRGAQVHLVALENQVDDAQVVHVGVLFGNSVVTRHTVREGGQLREYIAIFGHLEAPAPGLRRGQNVKNGALLGFVGDSGSPGIVHLHLEVRRVRDGVDVGKLAPSELAESSKTVVCDPRNVLPLR